MTFPLLLVPPIPELEEEKIGKSIQDHNKIPEETLLGVKSRFEKSMFSVINIVLNVSILDSPRKEI